MQKSLARTRWAAAGRAALALIGLAVVVLVASVLLRSVRGIHDEAQLPTRIHICDRIYLGPGDQLSLHEIAALGVTPIVVDLGPFGYLTACRKGVCTLVANGPCDTVIFVRVGEDSYVAYSLSGGP